MADLLTVEHLKKYFAIRGGFLSRVKGHVYAVNDVSLTIKQGETLGLVGESGCGKTTFGKVIILLVPPTDGTILFDGVNIAKLQTRKQKKNLRRNMQMVYQDPYASLNPRMPIKSIVGEPLTVHGMARNDVDAAVADLVEKVGLNPEHLRRFPHEFSGGQQQRIAIARALALNPRFIVLDEPTSSLDVSVQAQVLNLLKDLRERFGLTFLFISHDLSVINCISDRIAVMYLGEIVELARNTELFDYTAHPYTKALLEAIPVPDPDFKREKTATLLEGDVPSPTSLLPGCVFHPRCPAFMDICKKVRPGLVDVGGGHFVACHLTSQ